MVFAEDIPDTPALDPAPGKLCDHIIRIVSNAVTPQPLGSNFVPSMINYPPTNNKTITRRSVIVSEAVETLYSTMCAFVLFYVSKIFGIISATTPNIQTRKNVLLIND